VLKGDISPVSTPKNGHVYWFNYSILHEVIKTAGLAIEAEAFVTPKRILPKFLWKILSRSNPNLFASGYVVKCAPTKID
ncbi:unnamed protein product, partial [marine sediment metagenome]